jgi:hypothetical protein
MGEVGEDQAFEGFEVDIGNSEGIATDEHR